MKIHAGLLLLALTLAACSDKTDTTPPPSPTPSAAPSSATSPSPTPAPTPPRSATGLTVSSADAFAKFYLTAIDHAAATGDVAPLRQWSDKGCVACGDLIKHYPRVYDAGGSVTGMHRSTNVRTSAVRLNGVKSAVLTIEFTEGKHTIVPRKGAKPTAYPGGRSQWRMALFSQRGHWVMYEIEELT